MKTQNKKITQIKSNLPAVVLFGRTNVGKSTLFNKLAGRSQAVVSKIPGTTRDCNEEIVDWQGKKFKLIDTGGILNTDFLKGKSKLKRFNFDKTEIDNLVQLQVKNWLLKADIILFMADAKSGLMPEDRLMAILIKRLMRKDQVIILVANKADNPRDRNNIAEFHKLALGSPLPVSAATGSGAGDLLDAICKNVKSNGTVEQWNSGTVNVIILGKPNVGKSTLLNTILGEEKVIVSDAPHTTREPNDFQVQYQDIVFNFIDTAGIVRAKSKQAKDALIKSGMDRSLASLKRADVCLLVTDIEEGLSHQETKLADEILHAGVSVIIAANKWDKIEAKDTKQFTRYINSQLPFLTWAPIIFLSAKNKTKINQLLDLIIKVYQARNAKISDEELWQFLTGAVRHASPLSDKKIRGIMKHKLPKPIMIKIEQSRTSPPEFNLIAKAKLGIKENYIKYLENRLRDKFGLIGAPIKIIVVSS